jgi:hypothetical protein
MPASVRIDAGNGHIAQHHHRLRNHPIAAANRLDETRRAICYDSTWTLLEIGR